MLMTKIELERKFTYRTGRSRNIDPLVIPINAGVCFFNNDAYIFEREDKISVSMFLTSIRTLEGEQLFPRKCKPIYNESTLRLSITINFATRQMIRRLHTIRMPQNQRQFEQFCGAIPAQGHSSFVNFTHHTNLEGKPWPSILLPMIPDAFYDLAYARLGIQGRNNLTSLAWCMRTGRTQEQADNERLSYELLQASYAQIKNEGYRREWMEKNSKYVIRAYHSMRKAMRLNTPLSHDHLKTRLAALTAIHSVEVEVIPGNLAKAYLNNPLAIAYADFLQVIFRDVNNVRNILGRRMNTREYFNTPRDLKNDRDAFRLMILGAFTSSDHPTDKELHDAEVRLARKINLEQGGLCYLADTVKQIYRLRELGIRVKTAGNLSELHDEVSVLLNREERRARNVRYSDRPLQPDKQNETIVNHNNTYLIEYPQDPERMNDIGNELHNCVASYVKEVYCAESTIFTVHVNSLLTACCEVRRGTLVQSYGAGNSRLNKSLQNVINEYCAKQGYDTGYYGNKTRDDQKNLDDDGEF